MAYRTKTPARAAVHREVRHRAAARRPQNREARREKYASNAEVRENVSAMAANTIAKEEQPVNSAAAPR